LQQLDHGNMEMEHARTQGEQPLHKPAIQTSSQTQPQALGLGTQQPQQGNGKAESGLTRLIGNASREGPGEGGDGA
jgi:hypothetical protein